MKTTSLALANYLLTHPSLATAYKFNDPAFVSGSKALPFPNGPQVNKGQVDVQTARGGSSLIVATPDGGRFRVSLVLADNLNPSIIAGTTGATTSTTNIVPSSVFQAQGTVRAYAMPGGEVGLIVDGNTSQEQLEIDPLPFARPRVTPQVSLMKKAIGPTCWKSARFRSTDHKAFKRSSDSTPPTWTAR